jgi:CRP-like cAMP-binding protein
VPFFGPLPLAITEHLAAQLTPATYQPGDVIIAEGEPGDRFYLIESGQARATAAGRHLAELGPAGWFGEIALLRPAPRTATITATTPLHVQVLARQEFLAAVTGNPDSAQRADDVVSARLRASRQPGAQDATAASPGGNHPGLTSPPSQPRQA